MVKLEIRKEEEKDKPKEKILKVFLQQDSDGEIDFCVKDEAGRKWWIVTLTKKGRLLLDEDIPDGIGLDVDEEGRIKIEK